MDKHLSKDEFTSKGKCRVSVYISASEKSSNVASQLAPPRVSTQKKFAIFVKISQKWNISVSRNFHGIREFTNNFLKILCFPNFLKGRFVDTLATPPPLPFPFGISFSLSLSTYSPPLGWVDLCLF